MEKRGVREEGKGREGAREGSRSQEQRTERAVAGMAGSSGKRSWRRS